MNTWHDKAIVALLVSLLVALVANIVLFWNLPRYQLTSSCDCCCTCSPSTSKDSHAHPHQP